jgi:hypothetical protein
MKSGNLFSLSIAAASLALLSAQPVRAQSEGAQSASATDSSTATENPTVDPASASQEAAQMVPAEVHLVKALDARKVHEGDQFETIVDSTIHLSNGTELPHGTIVVGTVTTDQMRATGGSSLALEFTQARLKDGKVVPIHAMIAGITGPPSDMGYMEGTPAPPNWNRSSFQVDDIGVLSHVDLHSRIAGANSGVLVSSTRDDVKLSAGSRMALAIAAENSQPGSGT